MNTNGASRRQNVLRTWGHGYRRDNEHLICHGLRRDRFRVASQLALAGATPRPLPLAQPTCAKNKPALADFDPRKHRPGMTLCLYI